MKLASLANEERCKRKLCQEDYPAVSLSDTELWRRYRNISLLSLRQDACNTQLMRTGGSLTHGFVYIGP